jgi:hypothetical protein
MFYVRGPYVIESRHYGCAVGDRSPMSADWKRGRDEDLWLSVIVLFHPMALVFSSPSNDEF